MKKKLRKVGNSLSLSLPSDILKDMGLIEGNEVDIEYDFDSKQIKIQKANSTPPTDTMIELIKSVVEDVLKSRGL